MSLSVEVLSRLQFAVTIAFHYIYPPLTIGLGIVIVIMEGMFMKTKDVVYHNMSRFWTKIFGVIFVLGVSTGIVMEFEFGTNWATYSRFVGDIFGSTLAAEGIFAFFLESGALAILIFGWDKVSPMVHFISAIMISVGAHFSSIWIIIGNSWMQTPAGYHLEVAGKIVDKSYKLTPGDITETRAIIDNLWEMLFNPSMLDRLTHAILGAWLAGAFLVTSISAYYLLKNRHLEFAKRSMKIGLSFACVAIILQSISGDISAKGVAKNQPEKFAAMEGMFKTEAWAPFALFGWVDVKNEKTYAVEIPGLLSLMLYNSPKVAVSGLNDYPKEDWPNVQAVFQFYHIMIGVAVLIMIMCGMGVYLWRKGYLFDVQHKITRCYLWMMVFSVLLPQIGNQAGWFAAEMGRQPWIVYKLLRTSEGLSKAVKANQVWCSLIMFTLIYIVLLFLFLYLINKKIKMGPNDSTELHHLPGNWKETLSGNRAEQ